MNRFLWVLVSGCAALAGCSEKPASPAAKPMPPEEILARANDLANHHRVVEALQLLESQRGVIEALDPKTPRALSLRERQALLLLNVSRSREACGLLEEILLVKPDDARLRGFLGEAYLEIGEAAKALKAFESLPPGELRGRLVAYGQALEAAGRGEEGASVLAASLIRDPWQDAAYLALGRWLARSGREAAAQPFLERYRAGEPHRLAEQEALALEREGDTGRSLHRRARAEADRGRIFEALELDQRAVQIRRGLGDAYLHMARLSLRLGRPQDAIAVLEQLPDDPSVAKALEEARAEAARADEPFARLRERLRGRPLGACVPELIELSDALERAGKRQEGQAVALFALRLARSSRVAADAVLRRFSGPADVFTRLWALEPLGQAVAFEAAISSELTPLGVQPERVKKVLRLLAP